MSDRILSAKDIPQNIKDEYEAKVLRLRAQGQKHGIPDLEYKGNFFFLDNKGGGKYSPKNRAQKYNTDANRRASVNQNSITIEDYREYARRNGYPKELADSLYRQKEENLKRLQRSKGILAYEHFTPTTSKTYGGVEHPRNLGHLDPSLNGSKSDKLMPSSEARRLGIPLSKQSAIRMDFQDIPVVDKDIQMQNVLGAIEHPGTVKARTKNRRWQRIRQKGPIGKSVNMQGSNEEEDLTGGGLTTFTKEWTEPTQLPQQFPGVPPIPGA